MSKSPALSCLLKALDDIQAADVIVLDVHKQTSITDFMIVCSGRSSRHVRAVAEEAMEGMKKSGFAALRCSGIENGEWVLVDFGDLVLHVLRPEFRSFYNIEGLWQEAGASSPDA